MAKVKPCRRGDIPCGICQTLGYAIAGGADPQLMIDYMHEVHEVKEQ